MNGWLYLFNPEHDMALANFTPYYRPPREIIRMGQDLSYLPLWYAEKGSGVKVADECLSASFLAECISMGVHPGGVTATTWEGTSISPWGWDPALVNRLRSEGVPAERCPDEAELRRIRFLSGRQRCVEVLKQFGDMDGICGKAVECLTIDDVRNFMEDAGETILKSPWSGSGRGLLRISPDSWSENVEGWVARIIRTQGGIMGEPLYQKVCDFAMEFYADGIAGVSFAGYSLFETDSHGNYKLNLLLPDSAIEKRLSEYVPWETLHAVKGRSLSCLRALLGGDYTGYLGVDMMICHEAGKYVIHPCVEINLRMNMGVVSRLFFDRYVAPSSSGKYVVEHFQADGEAIEKHHRLMAESPLSVSDEGRILQGYLSLTPVVSETRYQAYVEVENGEGR